MTLKTGTVLAITILALVLVAGGIQALNEVERPGDPVAASSAKASTMPDSMPFQVASLSDDPSIRIQEHVTAYRRGPAFEGPDLDQVLSRKVTLQLDSTPAGAVGDAISDALGTRLVFVPREPSDLVSIDFKQIDAGHLVDVLAKRGAAAGIASGSRLYIGTNAATSLEVSSLLSELLGVPVEFTPQLEGDRLSLELKGAPVEEALALFRHRGALHFPE